MARVEGVVVGQGRPGHDGGSVIVMVMCVIGH